MLRETQERARTRAIPDLRGGVQSGILLPRQGTPLPQQTKGKEMGKVADSEGLMQGGRWNFGLFLLNLHKIYLI